LKSLRSSLWQRQFVMRQETNNEIDLLLRRMSRQDGGSARDREATEKHLDVDELSSYAQNALPAAARARYTQHLAECSTCRKLITELSLSLGATAAAAVPVEPVATPSALKKFLASLFSPMVMRYAIPALGLIIVAAIGLAIFRQKGNNTFVAQLDERQSAPRPSEAPASSSSPNAPVNEDVKRNRSEQTADPKEPASKSGDTSRAIAGTGPAPVGTPAPSDNVAPVTQPQAAAAPPAAKAAEPAKVAGTIESEEQRKENEEQKKKDATAKKQPETTVTVQSADTAAKTTANEPVRADNAAPKTGGERVDESKREALPLQRRGAFGSASSVARSRGQADNYEAETRTVSGRRFRKERGIWTDTAYDSSTATVNMARNSEQFRALIADEPEIKKIAEQLDGEVIVVWKGRAYRIR
jgi:hypothetical protein